MEFKHISVLLTETIDSLNIKPDGIYVDGTLGGGGHSYEICSRLTTGRLIGIDQDSEALKAAGERLKPFEDKVTLVKSNYQGIKNVLDELGIDKVDGILLDIGVSSYQLDNIDRGFSYKEDAPLDMRMDKDNPISAMTVVNEYDEMEIFRIIKDYGEEKFAKNIAKHIAVERKKAPVTTTGQLADIVKASIPMKLQQGGGHPAKRTFQAIRIEVNKELEVLEKSIDTMIDLLKDDGRLSIITFHSLEDRIVKNKFKENEDPCICPKDFPVCVCGRKPKGKNLFRKPVVPSEDETKENKRAKSSKLRCFVREIKDIG